MTIIHYRQIDLFEIIMDDPAPRLPVSVLAKDVAPLVQTLLTGIIAAERQATPARGETEVAE